MRLSSIGPAHQRQWGKMTVSEMLCHLSDAFRVSMGERQAQPIDNWATRSLMKWAALRVPIRWPHGVSTGPECDAKLLGTPPSEFEIDRDCLLSLLDRFARQPRGYALQVHPIFGKLTEEEWMRWGYLHTDHHLRQFGA